MKRVALRVDRTPEGWRRWYAYPVQDTSPGMFTISTYAYNRLSPGFRTRVEASTWASEHGCVVVS